MSTSIEWTRSEDGTPGETWNPTAGCSIKSAGCKNCYAQKMAHRLELMGGKPGEKYKGLTKVVNGKPVWTGDVRMHEDALTLPLSWKKPRMIFVDSMSDLFWGDDEDLEQARRAGVENLQPIPFEYIDRVFAVMALCPEHTFQILTKRPGRMLKYMSETTFPDPEVRILEAMQNIEMAPWSRLNGSSVSVYRDSDGGIDSIDLHWPLPNVWFGVSVEDQKTADERIPLLLQTPAAVRWVSYEPALGPVDFFKAFWRHMDIDEIPGYALNDGCTSGRQRIDGINWVVVGGESGPGARPFNLEWARQTVQQCCEADVPVFVKQIGAFPVLGSDHGTGIYPAYRPGARKLRDKKGGDMSEWPADLQVRQWPKVAG